MFDQHNWVNGEHPPKQTIDFTIPVFKEVLAIIDLSGNATKKLESMIKPDFKFFKNWPII